MKLAVVVANDPMCCPRCHARVEGLEVHRGIAPEDGDWVPCWNCCTSWIVRPDLSLRDVTESEAAEITWHLMRTNLVNGPYSLGAHMLRAWDDYREKKRRIEAAGWSMANGNREVLWQLLMNS